MSDGKAMLTIVLSVFVLLLLTIFLVPVYIDYQSDDDVMELTEEYISKGDFRMAYLTAILIEKDSKHYDKAQEILKSTRIILGKGGTKKQHKVDEIRNK